VKTVSAGKKEKYCQNGCINGECIDGLSCRQSTDCPLGICPNGKTYNRYNCLNGECYEIQYFADPCSVDSGSCGNGICEKGEVGFQTISRHLAYCPQDCKQQRMCAGKNIQACCSQWAEDNDIITIQCVGSWHIQNNQCVYRCSSTIQKNQWWKRWW
jgi:hypothetical protein